MDTYSLDRLDSSAVARDEAIPDVIRDSTVVMVGDSQELLDVRFKVDQVAPTDARVLLLGETGTGKGLVARLVHEQSRRRHARFVHVDCASLPATLIESELFGHERGAYTDAVSAQPGRFEIAHRGTIFLDEIGELPLHVQSKLLRVIQLGEFERLGSTRTVRVDVRIIAATNRSLQAEVTQGTFRSDLYYRLSVFPIVVPPLRNRADDIPILAEHIVSGLSRRYRKQFGPLSPRLLQALSAYDWPGNVRELENVLERAAIVSPPGTLELADPLGTARVPAAKQPQLLVDVERSHILNVLDQTAGRVEGSRGAARVLGLKPSTLRSRMQRLGIGRSGNSQTAPET